MRDDSRSRAISRGLLRIRISSRRSSRFSSVTPGRLLGQPRPEPRFAGSLEVPGVGFTRPGVRVRAVRRPHQHGFAADRRVDRASGQARDERVERRARQYVLDARQRLRRRPGAEQRALRPLHRGVGGQQEQRAALRAAIHHENRARRRHAREVVELIALPELLVRRRLGGALEHRHAVANLREEGCSPRGELLLRQLRRKERRSVDPRRGRLRRKRDEQAGDQRDGEAGQTVRHARDYRTDSRNASPESARADRCADWP